MEDCHVSVTSVKNIKYHHRLFDFLISDLRKFKGKSYIVCTKDTQKVLATFFWHVCNFKMSNALLGMFL